MSAVRFGRRAGARSLAAGSLVLVLGLAGASAALAADPPPCPPAPAAYSGDDPVVAELREQRADARAACLAITERQDAAAAAAHDDAAAVKSSAHDDAGTAHTDAGAVTDAIHAIPTPEPAAADAAYDGPSAGAFNDAGSTLHGDLWLLAGLLCALPVGLVLVRVFTPWWPS